MAKNTKKSTNNTKRSASSKNGSTRKTSAQSQQHFDLKQEVWSIVIVAVGIFLVVAMQTKAAGALGIIVSGFLKGMFGFVAFIVPYALIAYGILLLTRVMARLGAKTAFFLLLLILSIALINSGRFIDPNSISFSTDIIKAYYASGALLKSGGLIGMLIAALLVKVIGLAGLYILATVVIIISLLLLINTPIAKFFEDGKVKREERRAAREAKRELREKEMAELANADPYTDVTVTEDNQNGNDTPYASKECSPKISISHKKIMDYVTDDSLFVNGTNETEVPEPSENDVDKNRSTGLGATIDELKQGLMKRGSETKTESASLDFNASESNAEYQFPPISLLKSPPRKTAGQSASTLKERANMLEKTLRNFNVDAKVIRVSEGPAVTRYEIQPAPGVKVNRIVSLTDDIALNLRAKSIRIEAPIPGKAAVGIEIENESIKLVSIREIIASDEFKNAKSKISVALGMDIMGNAIITSLKDMPHLLIAGSTGSGKSVCINSIIVSLLYKAKPDEVKLLLVDPKVVELGNYNGIPHLLAPVVTDPAKAANVLALAVAEMNERYRKFASSGVKEIASYNELMLANGTEHLKLPEIVIIIDELADLMMAAPAKVQEYICRLAQMARAAGMHLIIATQRPSVDVITGVIKANIPSRIAFAVSSNVDSRTILDMGGAERLVGKGDMLFHPMGANKPLRIQGNFISDDEVAKVTDFFKRKNEDIEYDMNIIDAIEHGSDSSGDDFTTDGDELLADAIELVVSSQQASVSMLQRRFRIGYNRAARIVDLMEERGIVGPPEGSKPRRVLIDEMGLAQMNFGSDSQAQDNGD